MECIEGLLKEPVGLLLMSRHGLALGAWLVITSLALQMNRTGYIVVTKLSCVSAASPFKRRDKPMFFYHNEYFMT